MSGVIERLYLRVLRLPELRAGYIVGEIKIFPLLKVFFEGLINNLMLFNLCQSLEREVVGPSVSCKVKGYRRLAPFRLFIVKVETAVVLNMALTALK